MPRPLQKHVGVTINALLHADINTDPQKLARDKLTTASTIYRRISKVKVKITTGKPFPKAKAGRRSLVTPAIEAFVRQLYKEDPTWYHDEVADFVYDEFDVKLGRTTVTRLL